MTPEHIARLVQSLRGLVEAIDALGDKKGTIWSYVEGNYGPLIDKVDLKAFARPVIDGLEQIEEDPHTDKYAEVFITRVNEIRSDIVPKLFSNEGKEAYETYRSLLDSIEYSYCRRARNENWEKLADDGFLPKSHARRLRGLNSQINQQEELAGNLQNKIDYINNAHEAAHQLPTDLEELRERRDELTQIREAVEEARISVDLSERSSSEILKRLQTHSEDASKLIANLEDAYSAATSMGLGAAFEERAKRLTATVWVWVGGLALALAIGGAFGFERLRALQSLLQRSESGVVLWINFMIAFLAIAAPVWFAWLATKQIGHRFRLAEDYGFKAAIAKAYEGYRREAARLDPAFEARLFSLALDRLEEAPIRFVELHTPGSPFRDFWPRRREMPSTSTVAANQPESLTSPGLSNPPADS